MMNEKYTWKLKSFLNSWKKYTWEKRFFEILLPQIEKLKYKNGTWNLILFFQSRDCIECFVLRISEAGDVIGVHVFTMESPQDDGLHNLMMLMKLMRFWIPNMFRE